MKRYKPLFEEDKNFYSKFYTAVDYLYKTEDVDWYLSGGCYTFAYALGIILKQYKQRFDYYVMGQGIHYVVYYKNSYWDIQKDSSDITDKELNIYTTSGEDATWKKTTERDVMSNHNFNLKEAKILANKMRAIIENEKI